MKNTQYEKRLRLQLPREELTRRMRRVIQEELTELQRHTLVAYYFQQHNLDRIARERGVNKSTVCRTLHRAEDKLRRFLQY